MSGTRKTVAADSELIVIKSLDFDGCFGELMCILNPEFRKRAALSDNVDAILRRFLYESSFGIKLLAQLKNPHVVKVVFISSSNRLHVRQDLFCRIFFFNELNGLDNGSAFKALDYFVNFLKKELGEPGNKIVYDHRTLWDFYKMNDTPSSEDTFTALASRCPDFQTSKAELERLLKSFNEEEYFIGLMDKNKIIMTYVNLHVFARLFKTSHPLARVLFEIYDDGSDILATIFTAYGNCPALVPRASTLECYHYDLASTNPLNSMSKILKAKPAMCFDRQFWYRQTTRPIPGEGDIDVKPIENIKLLHRLLARWCLHDAASLQDIQKTDANVKEVVGLFVKERQMVNPAEFKMQDIPGSVAPVNPEFSASSSAFFKSEVKQVPDDLSAVTINNLSRLGTRAQQNH